MLYILVLCIILPCYVNSNDFFNQGIKKELLLHEILYEFLTCSRENVFSWKLCLHKPDLHKSPLRQMLGKTSAAP